MRPDTHTHSHAGPKIQMSRQNPPRNPQSHALSLHCGGPGNLVGAESPPSPSPGKHLILPTPRDEHLIKQQDEVDGECQEEGKESQGVEVPGEVVLR